MTGVGAWLALSEARLPFRVTVALLKRLRTPEAVFEALQAGQLGDVPDDARQRLFKACNLDLEARLAQLERLGARVVPITSREYPPLLRQAKGAPPVLYVRGRLPEWNGPVVAIVGSRRASPYGRVVAESLARDLAAAGVVVVSGGALGADTAAHRGALEVGTTIVVMGTGIDKTYPEQNYDLFESIAERGALVTELPLGEPPRGQYFPARNRIISGMSHGVVVVEAPEKSGALHTAEHAAAQGREVFAVPGTVNSALSRGCHLLIQQGAKLVSCVEDILEELPPLPTRKPQPAPVTAEMKPARAPVPPKPAAPAVAPGSNEEKLLHILTLQQKYIDQVVDEAELPPATVSAQLLMLELKGLVRRLPGNLYVRVR